MKYKIIACNVFRRELESLLPQNCDLEFFELGEHARPGELRKKLQEKIDESTGYDAVLLCYGLCGRATDGLKAGNIPLVIPRSHDCCGILLGSRKRFEDLFRPMPSTPFSSIGFMENGDYYFSDGERMTGDAYAALVREYGEDDANYIWEAMHPKLNGVLQVLYFIHTLPAPELAAKCREKMEKEGRGFRELDGNLRLIQMLMSGDHPEDEFLTVPPGWTIRQVGDWDIILKANDERCF